MKQPEDNLFTNLISTVYLLPAGRRKFGQIGTGWLIPKRIGTITLLTQIQNRRTLSEQRWIARMMTRDQADGNGSWISLTGFKHVAV